MDLGLLQVFLIFSWYVWDQSYDFHEDAAEAEVKTLSREQYSLQAHIRLNTRFKNNLLPKHANQSYLQVSTWLFVYIFVSW